MTAINTALRKILSGRWFLTCCCGIVFVYCSINGILTNDTVGVILIAVMKDYFSRGDRNGDDGQHNNISSEKS